MPWPVYSVGVKALTVAGSDVEGSYRTVTWKVNPATLGPGHVIRDPRTGTLYVIVSIDGEGTMWEADVRAVSAPGAFQLDSALMDSEVGLEDVIQVLPSGLVKRIEGEMVPGVLDGDIEGDGWEFASTGYTGQSHYHGPIMHDSELLSGRLAEDILSHPGIYAVVPAQYLDEDAGAIFYEGWAVLSMSV